MEVRTLEQLQMQNATSKAKKDASSLDQNDFMKLMLQQLKSQDPFKPTDNTEFISQMAQLTSVSGISEMNENLSALTGSLYSAQLLDSSSLIGKDVLVESGVAALPSGGSVRGQVELPTSTTALDIEILAPSGEVIGKVPMGPQAAGTSRFEWNGIGLNGERMPPGNYQIRANYLNGNKVEALTTEMRSAVISVSVPAGGGSPQVQIQGLGTVSLSQIKEIS
ncbi:MULTISPECIES: flagellar hook assembly protein FlgD [Zhongshania]|jgi:flagellar basal-body rod modification protein FlgD|uniref:Basal-body rod modification protein FlgD n=1 Tax=Zhongshania antarctica TaxID=641702 RepID=A0A840R328_9GAMM|nr:MULTISPECIES: flagellar hook assembly protein FlgD [Zhongshania]MBB5187003.1 flagellar basal-body rod modification protein FlgD [Zhongshania antarctica]|tara:strand:- start:5333 stop:5998 length:666 start_codon:yes stop_codon:yes gene_type:complete